MAIYFHPISSINNEHYPKTRENIASSTNPNKPEYLNLYCPCKIIPQKREYNKPV